jgi:CCR4-NOT transcription complex subunit 3
MSQRKLLQEIDKVFKKVKEGLEIFDGYYDKLQGCENQSQKEKLESDLKREIKKLQRQRDQIKTWLSGNDVKDKKQLLENRRLIENAMERFKVVEKNMKTKAFSREGLSMERVDPRQKEKDETSEFIHLMIEELERQNEKHEANIDQMQSSGKKGRKLDNNKQQEISELQEKTERNNWHLEKLEQILRLVANDQLDTDQVNDLQEDIKYYVESNEDPDFLEDDAIYDDLNLDDLEDAFGSVGEFATREAEEPESVLIDNTPKKLVSPASFAAAPSSSGSVPPGSVPPGSASKPKQHGTSHLYASAQQITPPTTSTFSTNNLKPAVLQKQELKYSSVASAAISGPNANGSSTATNSVQNTPKPTAPELSVTLSNNSSSTNLTNLQTPATATSTAPPPGLSSTPNMKPSVLSMDDSQPNGKFKESHEDSKDLLESFEHIKDLIQRPQPFDEISKMLDTSLLNCPDSYDSERPKTYYPTKPHPTSLFYPQEPLPELSYSSIISKLDQSTLFFNFYYNRGDYVQLLSARELCKKGWAFDKGSKKWYQKTEEIQPPTLVNGQIVSPEKKVAWKYFDYEGVWLARRMENFDADSVQLQTSF